MEDKLVESGPGAQLVDRHIQLCLCHDFSNMGGLLLTRRRPKFGLYNHPKIKGFEGTRVSVPGTSSSNSIRSVLGNMTALPQLIHDHMKCIIFDGR